MRANNGKGLPGRDAIEQELHAVREAYAREFGYDVHAMFEDLRAQQEKSGRSVVSFPARRVGEGQGEGTA